MQRTFWRFTGISSLPWRTLDNIKYSMMWMIRRRKKNNISPTPFWIWYVVGARLSSSTPLSFFFSLLFPFFHSPWSVPLFHFLYSATTTDIHVHTPKLSLSFSRAMISIYTLNTVISMTMHGNYVKNTVIDLNGPFFSRNAWQLNQQPLRWLQGHVWIPQLV